MKKRRLNSKTKGNMLNTNLNLSFSPIDMNNKSPKIQITKPKNQNITIPSKIHKGCMFNFSTFCNFHF